MEIINKKKIVKGKNPGRIYADVCYKQGIIVTIKSPLLLLSLLFFSFNRNIQQLWKLMTLIIRQDKTITSHAHGAIIIINANNFYQKVKIEKYILYMKTLKEKTAAAGVRLKNQRNHTFKQTIHI